MRYRTIVADPPWSYRGSIPGWMHATTQEGGRGTHRSVTPYETMTVDEIAALPVPDLAEDRAHLYLWTTNTHLPLAFRIVEGWGFRYSTLLVWCKNPMGKVGTPTYPIQTEFVLFARRGSLVAVSPADRNWWNWTRPNAEHSRKPEAFLDVVEQVSPGPYLEMFARRNRLGWDTFGNEALEHVEL